MSHHGDVLGQQLDLFADAQPDRLPPPAPFAGRGPAAADMDDDALVAAISAARLADCAALAAEAGRRRLRASVSALEGLCWRFAGYGLHRTVPEQAAALAALAEIGGRDAARVVATLIARGVFQGPNLAMAMEVAARLEAVLPKDVVTPLLQSRDARVRANACHCAAPKPELVPVLVPLLDDPDPTVARVAACALGQMGRSEGRPVLTALLRQAPASDVIAAVAPIADEECMILLGRLARSAPSLAAAALSALDEIDHPRAAAIASGVRRAQPERGAERQSRRYGLTP